MGTPSPACNSSALLAPKCGSQPAIACPKVWQPASLPSVCSTAAATSESLAAKGAAMCALPAGPMAAHPQQRGSKPAPVPLAVPPRAQPMTSAASLHLAACTSPSSPAVPPACTCPACSLQEDKHSH